MSIRGYLNITVVLLCILLKSQLNSQDMRVSIYSSILGKNDVKQVYKDLVHKALSDFGCANPEKVAVKRMNSLGSLIAGVQISSFTAFGIWLDEEYLDACTIEQQTFQIYHEAAHYVKNHHSKLLAKLLGLVAVNVFIVHCLQSKSSQNHLGQVAKVCCMLFALLGSGKLVSCIVKNQEKEADICAAKRLNRLGESDVVNAYIQDLYSLTGNDSLWWYAPLEQVLYLKDSDNE